MSCSRARSIVLFATVLLILCAMRPSVVAEAKAAADTTFVSNLGIRVLTRATLVVRGSISETQKKTGIAFSRDLVISEVLYGSTELSQLSVLFVQSTTFESVKDQVALALKPVSGSTSSFELIGAPLKLDTGATIATLKSYVELERAKDTREEKLAMLKARIDADIGVTGVRARFAAVELLFAIQRYPQLFSHTDYERLRELSKKSETRVGNDLKLAARGMVSLFLKADVQVEVLKGKDEATQAAACRRLSEYFDQAPDAFVESDVRRCDLIGAKASPKIQRELAALKVRMELLIASRKKADNPRGESDKPKEDTDTTPALAPSTPSPFELPEKS